MSNAKLDALRIAVRDEALPPTERRQAAQLLISELVDTVPEPAENDADVVELLTQPTADGPLGKLLPMARKISNETRGWAGTGPTTVQARRFIHEKRRTELLKTIYRDGDRHDLERECAAQRLLDALSSRHMMHRNGVTAKQLIEQVG